MKTCSKCGESKDESAFYARSRQCKPCRNEVTNEYRRENKEKIAAQDKLRRVKSKEKRAVYVAAYRLENKEKIAARTKLYRVKNKEKLAEWYKLYSVENKEKIAARSKRYVSNVSNRYAARLLGVKASEVPKELLEVKRMNLLIKRHIKENSK